MDCCQLRWLVKERSGEGHNESCNIKSDVNHPSPHTRALEVSQVAGHAGMRTTGDGSLIIKPAFPAELQFYQTLLLHPNLIPLQPFIPKFIGTVKDEGQVDGTTHFANISVPPGRTQFLLLENLCHPFLKPNTLDVKLGTVFHDDSTLPDKVIRMEKTARETTSLETGIRLTEFQVYDNMTCKPIGTPKSYGKLIKSSDLPDGIARFFPENGESSSTGLPRRTLLPILRAIRKDISKIRKAYSPIEMRMVGASLLIMYEADWIRAEEAVKRLGQVPKVEESGNHDHDNNHANRSGPPCVVKLIDFAHTCLTPGQGPDKGVLLGMDTMLRLLDGRIAQLESGQ